MLKKATVLTRPAPARQDAPFRRQGRSERRGEEVRTALRGGRSPLHCVLANGKALPVFPPSSNLLLRVEPLSEARTPHGKRRVSARRGRAGEKSDFFSILLHVCGPSGEGAQSCHMISCRGSPASPQPNPRLAMWTGSAVCWNIGASASKNFACDPPISKPRICCYLDT